MSATLPTQGSSSAVATEIRRFAALSETWWDPNGPFAPLHAMNPVRLGYIRDHLAPDDTSITPLSGKAVLDVGCGGGLLSEPLARMGASITGVDAAAEGIEVARAHALSQGLDVNYICTTAEAFLSEHGPEKFDVICALEIIEHVADSRAFVHTLSKLLKPGGQLFISTINRTSLSFVFAIVGAEYITRKIPRGTHDWRKFLAPHQVGQYCRVAGLTVRDVTGMFHNPILRTWTLSTNRMRINYIMNASRPD